jgi:hypothetical protein
VLADRAELLLRQRLLLQHVHERQVPAVTGYFTRRWPSE